MFGFLKSKERRHGEPFDTFLFGRVSADPAVSVEEILDQFIREHDFGAREHLDEPQYITDLRTRLRILQRLERFVRDHPACGREPRFQKSLAELRSLVGTLATMSPSL